MEVGSLAFGEGTCGSWFQFSQALLESPWLHLVAMVRKTMHRISAGPASQRDVRRQSHFSPSSAWASRCPAAIGSFQAEVARDDFLRTINQFADAWAGGPGDVLSAFGLPRELLVAVVMELFHRYFPKLGAAAFQWPPARNSRRQSCCSPLECADGVVILAFLCVSFAQDCLGV